MLRQTFAGLAGTLALGAGIALAPPPAQAACLSTNSTNNCVTFNPTTDSFVNKNFYQTVLGTIINAGGNLQLAFAGLNGIDYSLSDIKLNLEFANSGDNQIFSFPNATIIGNNPSNTPPFDVYLSSIVTKTAPNLTNAFLTYTIAGNPAAVTPDNGIVADDSLFTSIIANDTAITFNPTSPTVRPGGPGAPNRLCSEPSVPNGCLFAEGKNGYDSVQLQVERQQSVPGPLPILGAGVALGFSRRLRRRIVSAS